MRLFILAAGKGKRLEVMTRHVPKPLITIDNNGTTILEYNVNHALTSRYFNEITVITGYKSYIIEQCLQKYQSTKVNSIFNEMYHENGPISSLSKVKEFILEEDCVIINGDTLYDSRFFEILKEQTKTGVFYSKKNIYQKDEVKVTLSNRYINYAGKNIEVHKADGVSAGFVRLEGQEIRERFCYYIDQMSKTNVIWHEIINNLIQDRIQLLAFEIDEEYWYEIDTIQDYNRYQLLKG